MIWLERKERDTGGLVSVVTISNIMTPPERKRIEYSTLLVDDFDCDCDAMSKKWGTKADLDHSLSMRL
jgi:hypothetical protein